MAISKTITITNKLGLHARAAARFVETASRFRSAVQVICDTYTANGKSIMAMMTLGATQGTALTLTIDGCDEQAALNDLVELVQQRFGEAQ